MTLTRAKALTRKRRAVLEAFMRGPDNPEGTLSYREAQGLIFTVACAPELVPPSEWLPVLFGGDEPSFESSTQAETIIGILMDLFNDNAPRVGKEPQLPLDCAFMEDIMANLEPHAPIAQWCRGFVLGHSWLMDCWTHSLPERWEGELATSTMVLSFFASRRVAEAFLKESTKEEGSLEEAAQLMRNAFPTALAEYSDMGDSIFKALRDERMEEEEPASPPPPGRNDPCSCGSGRKYKRCCGGLAH